MIKFIKNYWNNWKNKRKATINFQCKDGDLTQFFTEEEIILLTYRAKMNNMNINEYLKKWINKEEANEKNA